MAQGDTGSALKHLDEAISIFTEQDDMVELAKALFYYGRMLVGRGDDEGGKYLDRAAGMFSDMGMMGWLERVRKQG